MRKYRPGPSAGTVHSTGPPGKLFTGVQFCKLSEPSNVTASTDALRIRSCVIPFTNSADTFNFGRNSKAPMSGRAPSGRAVCTRSFVGYVAGSPALIAGLSASRFRNTLPEKFTSPGLTLASVFTRVVRFVNCELSWRSAPHYGASILKLPVTGLDQDVETGGPPTWRRPGFRARSVTRASRSSVIGSE
jgi:hypothetical protein